MAQVYFCSKSSLRVCVLTWYVSMACSGGRSIHETQCRPQTFQSGVPGGMHRERKERAGKWEKGWARISLSKTHSKFPTKKQKKKQKKKNAWPVIIHREIAKGTLNHDVCRRRASVLASVPFVLDQNNRGHSICGRERDF